jgi:hypothetical protein
LTQNREKKKKNKGPKSIPAETSLPAETGQNRPEQADILAEVEHRGDSYRLACWYEIFRPFRPERNGLYNTDIIQVVVKYIIQIQGFIHVLSPNR